jgi:membrane-bound lytic murein transglycosylase D
MIPVNSSYYRHREPPIEIEHVVSREQPRSNDGTRLSIHIVERGETLSSIAEDYGTTVADLKRINHLRRSAIKPRMKLHIIANSSSTAHNTSESQTAPTTSVASNAKVKSPLATSVFYHRVLRYENLNKIAAFYGVSISDLKRWNHLASNRVRSGQRLRVMPPSVADQKGTPTAKPSATEGNNVLAESQDPDSKMIYRVRRGDSLWSIAKKFRVSMNKLREWNDNAGDIRPGQQIIIYN